MAIPKGPVDGGQGGRLGHSNMNHWDYTDAIKAGSRKWRRLKAKIDIAEALTELQHDSHAEPGTSELSDEFPEQPNQGS